MGCVATGDPCTVPVTGRVWLQCGFDLGLVTLWPTQVAGQGLGPQVRPGATTAPPAPARPISANYINHRRENSNGGSKRRGHKSKERGPTSCQTIPSRPHHIRFLTTSASIISISPRPQNFTRPTQHQLTLAASFPADTASRCTQISPLRLYTHSAYTAPVTQSLPTAVTAAGTLCPGTETQPTVSAPDRDPP